MRINKILPLLLTMIAIVTHAQQKEPLYLSFVSGTEHDCFYGPLRDGSKNQKISYTDKFTMGGFEMCYQQFAIIPGSTVEKLTSEQYASLPIRDIDYFLRATEVNAAKGSIDYNTAFKKIYVLVNTPYDYYLKFEVKWIEIFK